jgi:hypothetical protein
VRYRFPLSLKIGVAWSRDNPLNFCGLRARAPMEMEIARYRRPTSVYRLLRFVLKPTVPPGEREARSSWFFHVGRLVCEPDSSVDSCAVPRRTVWVWTWELGRTIKTANGPGLVVFRTPIVSVQSGMSTLVDILGTRKLFDSPYLGVVKTLT